MSWYEEKEMGANLNFPGSHQAGSKIDDGAWLGEIDLIKAMNSNPKGNWSKKVEMGANSRLNWERDGRNVT